MKYFLTKTVNISFEEAVKQTTEGLKTQGFGILSDIDMHEKFKEKLNLDFRRYKILGACNPAFAHKAVLAEDKIGVLLPCSVIVQEWDHGKVEVSAISPVNTMSAIDNPAMKGLAEEVENALQKALDGVN